MNSRRSLQTILFTDIVGSTERASELGDRAWRRLLEEHDANVRRELHRFGGQEIDTAGDGFLAVLQRPGMAIACAAAICDAVREAGLEVRCGVHTGEVETMGESVSGIGVHIAARVMAEAGPGEVLVSRSAHDAVEGSGFGFEDRGARTLKGITGAWQLFAVTNVPPDASDAITLDQLAAPNRWRRKTGRRGLAVGVIGLAFLVGALYFALQDQALDSADIASTLPTTVSHRQVTFTGEAGNPAISPDGKMIAYTTRWEGGGGTRLLVKDLSGGGEPVELTRFREVWQLRWSPKGSHLLVGGRTLGDERYAGFLIPVLGGSMREISRFPFSAWSPDGRNLANTSQDAKRLWFIDLSTSDTTSIGLPDSFRWIVGLDWSPTGEWIALHTISDPIRWAIWTINVDGSRLNKLVDEVEPIRSVRWAPSGEGLYYARVSEQAAELIRVDVSPATGEPLSPPHTVLSGLEIRDFDLSIEGTRLLYARGHSSMNLWLVSPFESVGSELRQITRGTKAKFDPSISPDGRLIAIIVGSSAANPWSRSNLYVMPLEGGPMTQLTFFEDASIRSPAWSPDGSEIAFAAIRGGTSKVWKIAARGGSPHPISKHEVSGSTMSVRWAPGRQILYQLPGNRNFQVLDPETSSERSLVKNDSVGWMFEPQYSPDETRIAVHWNRDPRGLWVVSLNDDQQLYLGGDREIPIGWSAQGDSVYAYDQNNTIIRFPIQGQPERLFTIECGARSVPRAMTPDAKQFLCSGYEGASDLWIAENFDSPEAQRTRLRSE